ncbi:MAG: hypothetical protein VB861_18585, partial [Planctomycetaceae bacterium]
LAQPAGLSHSEKSAMTGSRLQRPLGATLATLVALYSVVSTGCSDPQPAEIEAKRPRKRIVLAEVEAKRPVEANRSKKSIFKQRTQDVGEFDPKAGKQLSDSKIRATSPLLAGLEAYGPVAEKVTKLAIQHHLNIYNALHGHYPKDHAEFMREIIKKQNLQLPKLPYGNTYEYDVANHKLVVVKGKVAK